MLDQSKCSALTLPEILSLLTDEKQQVTDELNTMPPDAWLNVRSRELANREQELHTTLNVLQGLTRRPVSINEPVAETN